MSLFYLFFWIGVLWIGGGNLRSRADFWTHPWEGVSLSTPHRFHSVNQLEAEVQVLQYSPDSYLNREGQRNLPSDLISYQRREANLLLKWGALKQATFFGRLNMNWVDLQSSSLKGSQSYLGDQAVGINFEIYRPQKLYPQSERPIGFIHLQAQTDFSLSALVQTGVTTVQQESDWTLGPFFSLPLWFSSPSQLRLGGGAGYRAHYPTWRGAGVWSAYLEYKQNNLLIQGGGVGFFSLQSPLLDLSTQSFGLMSAGFPLARWTAFQGTLGYIFNLTTLFSMTVRQTLMGQAAPYGFQVSAQLSFPLSYPQERSAAQKEAHEYGKSNRGFLNYSLSAKILQVQDRLNLVKVDQGSEDGILPGDRMDLFQTNAAGEAQRAVARSKVIDVKPHEAVLEVLEYYQGGWIEEGFIAKKLIRTE